jgi:hypothetical protein
MNHMIQIIVFDSERLYYSTMTSRAFRKHLKKHKIGKTLSYVCKEDGCTGYSTTRIERLRKHLRKVHKITPQFQLDLIHTAQHTYDARCHRPPAQGHGRGIPDERRDYQTGSSNWPNRYLTEMTEAVDGIEALSLFDERGLYPGLF